MRKEDRRSWRKRVKSRIKEGKGEGLGAASKSPDGDTRFELK
jgi:hypothetical protein